MGLKLGQFQGGSGIVNTLNYVQDNLQEVVTLTGTGNARSLQISVPLTLASTGEDDPGQTSTDTATTAASRQWVIDAINNALTNTPSLSGTPTAPTADQSTNNSQIATTKFVHTAINNITNGASAALDTLKELGDALGNDPNFATTVTNSIATKASLASPAFTGTPTAPTADKTTSNTQIATTAFVHSLTDDKQPLHAALTSISGLTTAANKMIYTTAANVYATSDISQLGRELLAQTTIEGMRGKLGVTASGTQVNSAASADVATQLKDSHTIQTKLNSTIAASFNGTADITPGITGTLGVGNGGTGATTLAANAVVTGNGTSAVKTVATASGALFATAVNGAPSFGTLPIAQGGTGLTASPSMLTNLGSTTAADVLTATPKPGVTGTLSVKHGGTGATTLTSNAILAGNTTSKVKEITTASGALYATQNNGAASFGTLPIAQGGTSLTSSPSMLTNLGSTTAADVFVNAPRPGVMGTLGIANGGTGGTTEKQARRKLGFFYEKCATAAATAAKVASNSDDFVFSSGCVVWIHFNKTNTADNPTLNINGTGDFYMIDNDGVTLSGSSYLKANAIICFIGVDASCTITKKDGTTETVPKLWRYVSTSNDTNMGALTGTMSVGNGGTGVTTLASNAVVTGNGTSAVKTVATASGALYATAANGAAQFGTLPVEQGGTAITTNPSALTNLASTTAANLFATAPRPGVTGTLGVGHGGTGRDTITANAILAGNTTSAVKMIATASGALYATAANGAASFGTLPVAQGGTGATTFTANAIITGNGTSALKTVATASGAAYATAANGALTFGTLPIAQGGTSLTSSPSMLTDLGSTTAANILTATPKPGVTGTLPIAHGGTGGTTESSARFKLGFAYGGCTTKAGTAAKTLAASGFTFTQGARVIVRVSNSNTATDPTLNVNSTGAFYMLDNANKTLSGSTHFYANSIVEFVAVTGSTYTVTKADGTTEDVTSIWRYVSSSTDKDFGTFGVANGGTGRATLTANAVLAGNTTSAVKMIATASGALYATAANGAASFGTLPVAQGGTGLTANPSMLTNLASTTAANVLATSPRPGVTGTLPVSHGGTGATTFTANAVLTGNTTSAFNAVATASGALYATKANGTASFGTLPVAQGGTGLTASPSMLTNLASTSAANVMAASPRPGVTGTLPIGNGGTGQTTAQAALAALGFGYAACTTAGGTAAKAATRAGFCGGTIYVGAIAVVRFTKTNTVNNPTLTFGGLGPYPIYYRGSVVPAAAIRANYTYTFVYNTTSVSTGAWDIVGSLYWTT